MGICGVIEYGTAPVNDGDVVDIARKASNPGKSSSALTLAAACALMSMYVANRE